MTSSRTTTPGSEGGPAREFGLAEIGQVSVPVRDLERGRSAASRSRASPTSSTGPRATSSGWPSSGIRRTTSTP